MTSKLKYALIVSLLIIFAPVILVIGFNLLLVIAGLMQMMPQLVEVVSAEIKFAYPIAFNYAWYVPLILISFGITLLAAVGNVVELWRESH